MTPQSTFLIFAPIAHGRVEELRALLATMTLRPGLADPQNPLVPFGRFDRLHVARLLVIEVDTWRDMETAYGTPAKPFPAHLAFLGDIDGDRDSFLAGLAQLAGEGLRRIFSFCEGFRAVDDLLGWMRKNNVDEAANYVNTRGRTVLQVHEEDRLRRALAAQLPAIVARTGEADGPRLHRELVAFAAEEQREGRLVLTPDAPTPLGHRITHAADLIGVPMVLLLLSPVILIASPFLLLRLRQLERSDPELLPRPDDARLSWIAEFEDHDVTNPFSAAGDLKPGVFRRSAAAFFLFMLGWSGRHIFGRGYLTRVQSIHFARWVFFDNRRRVLFFSNYDGSLESYMDDFINKVAWGLNLVFSNGVGYPSTRFLIKGGAEQEVKFKRYLRNRHQATDVWYKAYPGLSTFDLSENTRIRRGLQNRPVGARALRHWLAGIRR